MKAVSGIIVLSYYIPIWKGQKWSICLYNLEKICRMKTISKYLKILLYRLTFFRQYGIYEAEELK